MPKNFLPLALAQALESLKTYDTGSPRGMLLPIDDAVARASNSPREARVLETQLLGAWPNTSTAARLCILGRLTLLATDRSIALLRECLRDPAFSHAARNVLEVMRSSRAAAVLREALPKSSGAEKAGIINSLAVLGDLNSLDQISKLLTDDDRQVAAAAIAALGNIGTPRAERILRAFAPSAPAVLQPEIAHALLCFPISMLSP